MKAPESFYKGTNKLEKHRGNSKEANAKHKALKEKIKGPIPKHDWRKGKSAKMLNSDYPDAKPGSDYMGSR